MIEAKFELELPGGASSQNPRKVACTGSIEISIICGWRIYWLSVISLSQLGVDNREYPLDLV